MIMIDPNIDESDASWIENNVDEPISESKGDFSAELFLSTDGKNTVHVKADTPEGRKAALAWAKLVYSRLLASYGTKKGNEIQAMKTNGITCETCGKPAEEKSGTSKAGKPYHGIFCSSDDRTHTKWIR